ncbi:MAG: DUF3987 domain-containing protein [Aridibacter sp.]
MTNFAISLFKSKFDNKPRRVQRTWTELTKRFQKPAVRKEKDGALFSPAIFEPVFRRKENVQSVSLLVLDIDHNADLETIKNDLTALDVAFAIYSTHSHLRRTTSNPKAEPRFRVCLPLASEIPAKDFPALWQYVKQETNLPLDESAKDVCRMFYTPVKADENADYQFYISDGEFLDWQSLPLDSYRNGTKANEKIVTTDKQTLTFEYHEQRHTELCKRIEAQAKATGRGTFEMKCPAHNGNGNSSLFYDPTKQTVACIKKPNPCGYFEILNAFGLSNGRLPSLEKVEKENAEFEQIETKIKPFPVPNEKCFYGLAGDFIRLLEPHTEASPMALLFQFLVYFGNVIGRTGNYKVECDKHFTNLFCVLVGKTAQGRKGTSFGRVKEIFRGLDEHHEQECVTGGLASGEGLIYHVRDAQITQKKNNETKELEDVVTDSGVSDKRLLVVESEFAQVLRVQGREGNTLSSNIRNLWDTGTARSLTKNSPLKTTDAHVSIIGHITKDELLIALSEVEAANGYANRFLFCAVERARLLPFGADVPKVELAKLQDRLSDAILFSQQKGQMNFSIEASKLWVTSYEKLETSRFGFLAKITQRASPYVLRIALIFALLDKSPLIEKQHLEAALSVWQYSEDSARYVFGESLGNQTAERILTALKENQETGLTRTEVRDLFDRNKSKTQLDSALHYLLETKLAKFEKQKTKGKPKEVWFAVAYDNNDQNDQSLENEKSLVVNVVNVVSEETKNTKTFNAYNAYNANTGKESCPTCDKELVPYQDNQVMCEICLYTKTL